MQYVVIGDVHLTRHGAERTARDLTAVVRAHRGATLVFAGDLLDLAAEELHEPAPKAMHTLFGVHQGLREALGEHLAAGGTVQALAGNHDDALATTEGSAALLEALALDPAERARVRVSPWFARLGPGGALHVEHGHHYDPDNALPHPLTPPDPAWRSLGIELMHRFVSPLGIHSLVHSNDRTPLGAIARCAELFGARTPWIIARYFAEAAREVARAGSYPSAQARAQGEAALEPFAQEVGLPLELVRSLVAAGAEPTVSSMRATFFRLYWDRLLPMGIAGVAGASALLGGPGRRVAVGATLVAVGSMMLTGNRYTGRVQRAMHGLAEQIADTTGARAVVFGHIHRPVGEGLYRNTGSFGFPGDAPGRPYVLVDDEDLTPERRFHRAS